MNEAGGRIKRRILVSQPKNSPARVKMMERKHPESFQSHLLYSATSLPRLGTTFTSSRLHHASFTSKNGRLPARRASGSLKSGFLERSHHSSRSTPPWHTSHLPGAPISWIQNFAGASMVRLYASHALTATALPLRPNYIGP